MMMPFRRVECQWLATRGACGGGGDDSCSVIGGVGKGEAVIGRASLSGDCRRELHA